MTLDDLWLIFLSLFLPGVAGLVLYGLEKFFRPSNQTEDSII
jgi:uncharacterized membrane protein YqaE (UPF0057 family)